MESTRNIGDRAAVDYKFESPDQLMAPITEFQKNWLAAVTKANGEFFSFMSRRLEKDLEAAAELAKCKNPADVLQTQMQFVEQMTADYTAEAPKIAKIITDLTTDGLTPKKNGHARDHSAA